MSNSAILIDNLYISIKHTDNAIKSGIICKDISDQLPIFVFVESNISNVKKGPIVRTKRHFNEYVFNDISQKLENTDLSYLINCNVDEVEIHAIFK